MGPRRLVIAALMAVLGWSTPAVAAPHLHARRSARQIVRADVAAMLRFLRAQPGIDRVAVRDIDNDGDLDILAAPRQGDLRLWRNSGNGRFKLALHARAPRLAARGSRIRAVAPLDDMSPWGDERYDAAMPRAPATGAAIVPAALVRTSSPAFVRSSALRRISGRAPPRA